jgi:hypothetical protein
MSRFITAPRSRSFAISTGIERRWEPAVLSGSGGTE